MKTIYLVRHGQTEGNAGGMYQHWDIALSGKGRNQAQAVAKRLSRVRSEAVIASDMARANETARIIAEHVGHKVVLEPLLREIYRPSVIRGKSLSDPDVMAIRKFTDENFDTGYKHSDEENFADLKIRGLKTLDFILARPENNLIIVTHGTYLRMLISLMVFGEGLLVHEFLAIEHHFYTSNTGITKCTHAERWQIINWNDDAHLG